MEKTYLIFQYIVMIFFGICFFFIWEPIANRIIEQDKQSYGKHKNKIKLFFYFLGFVFIWGGVYSLYLLMFGHPIPQNF